MIYRQLAGSDRDPPDPTDRILVCLRRIARAVDLRSRTLFQNYGLTSPQLIALQAIAQLQPVTAGGIAKAIHLGQPTVTGILNRLESRGLITRVRGDRDRRSVLVRLTSFGEQTLANAPPLLHEQFREELVTLTEWERTQILATLQRIADMMDADRIPGAPVVGSGTVKELAEIPPLTVDQPLLRPVAEPLDLRPPPHASSENSLAGTSCPQEKPAPTGQTGSGLGNFIS